MADGVGGSRGLTWDRRSTVGVSSPAPFLSLFQWVPSILGVCPPVCSAECTGVIRRTGGWRPKAQLSVWGSRIPGFSGFQISLSSLGLGPDPSAFRTSCPQSSAWTAGIVHRETHRIVGSLAGLF